MGMMFCESCDFLLSFLLYERFPLKTLFAVEAIDRVTFSELHVH
jgi:hypothetical protein